VDTLTPEQRSARMSAILGSNTKPEMAVRRLLHGLGYRFKLHDRRLPGTPDIVFRGRRKVVFVHGCFWHRHEGCRISHLPKSRQAYWEEKLARNVARDERQRLALEEEGWRVHVVWECGLRDPRFNPTLSETGARSRDAG
jgi:DNA mismatch endonuclease, patch repair protein